MPDQLAIVTGASGGLGSYICRFLAERGVGLILLDRNAQKAQAFAATLNATSPGIVRDTFAVDLASHPDIRRVADAILAKYPRLDYLFNNAGVLTETLQFSAHQNELHFEVNTLAPLQLIDRLHPALKAAGNAVIVSTSAGLALRAKTLDWNQLLKPSTFEKLYGPYVNSKQALNVITAALAPELSRDNILIRTADPGPNQTGLTKGKGTPLWMRLFYRFLPTPDKGAKKIFDAGLSDRFKRQTGIFVSGGKVAALAPALEDPAFQQQLLARCRERAAIMD